MTDADRERLRMLDSYCRLCGYTESAAALRRLLAELDAVTAERDQLQAVVVEQAKEE